MITSCTGQLRWGRTSQSRARVAKTFHEFRSSKIQLAILHALHTRRSKCRLVHRKTATNEKASPTIATSTKYLGARTRPGDTGGSLSRPACNTPLQMKKIRRHRAHAAAGPTEAKKSLLCAQKACFGKCR